MLDSAENASGVMALYGATVTPPWNFPETVAGSLQLQGGWRGTEPVAYLSSLIEFDHGQIGGGEVVSE